MVFTGIVEGTGKVISARPGKLVISASKVLEGIKPGDSVDVNGVCLTVTTFDKTSFSVDIMSETVKRTNLGKLSVGDEVNLERPLALGSGLGGHLVQGHVDATGKIVLIRSVGDSVLIRIEAPVEVMRYVVEKGFIAIDGISLTVVEPDARSFAVSIVEYTRQHTNLGKRKVGDPVNLEVDIIAKYVEKFSQTRRAGVTVDLLREHGFLMS